ncbi:MAG TPA: phenylalanine--tRNA ligase subunit beta, partial [Propionibacteriaceae bacterium]|nr:phenylalanine--tRNA ligase subunit beta [Propionibacteriaceae bacterium]
MRAPLSWLRDFAALPNDLDARGLGEALIRAGLEVETISHAGADVVGPLVIGRVVSYEVEEHRNGKSIRYCRVDVADHNDETGSRGIVCGAHNFENGDFVVVALPGAVLPGGFQIAARKAYGHISDGMICSARELGLGDDHSGILVLADDHLEPGADAVPILRLRDDVLDVAVTPDRGYCLSIRGLARESAQATGVAFTDPVDRPVPAAKGDGYPVRLESDACPLFVAVTVTGIDPTRPSPLWLSRRVQLAGMRSISLPVDITNYVMLETGQPIHAYDADLLDGPIVVRKATEGEKLTTLDDVVRPLHPGDLLITDATGPIGLAGVMGGASTELSASTTSVVIEAAHFDAMTIARTSRRHKLSSEASRRFERGVDPGATYAAAHRVGQLLVELAGGTLTSNETVVGSVPASPSTTIADTLPAAILGADIDHDTAVELLRTIGAAVVEHENGRLTITPPSWRPDLADPYDYVEEVGRQIGFDTIEPVVPRAPVGRGLTRSQRARRDIATALATSGFVEVLSSPFLSIDELDRLGVPADDERRRLNRILNPLSETSPYLRTTILPGLLTTATRNRSRGNDDLALFESGSVFYANDPLVAAPQVPVSQRPSDEQLARLDRALGRQPRHLGAVLSGQWRPDSWLGPAEPAGWQHAIAFVEVAARVVGLRLSRRATEREPWHPGRCAEFVLPDGAVLGQAGELHPAVCDAFGLPPRVAAAEIDLDALIAAAPERGDVAAISTFPVAKEDVALIVDIDVPAGIVERALRSGAGPLLESLT